MAFRELDFPVQKAFQHCSAVLAALDLKLSIRTIYRTNCSEIDPVLTTNSEIHVDIYRLDSRFVEVLFNISSISIINNTKVERH